ncbi:MAG TPA: chemotaxis response regulator protein-glutamate methylesterase [Rhizomicrobium sp.]
MSSLAPHTAVPAARIRVMVVDDSAVVRGLTARILESEPAIEVVASCSNGLMAIQQLARRKVDVIILDIEMPVMDGLSALPGLLAIDPSIRIIVASTLTQRNAEISLTALAQGAADYIPKPSTGQLRSAEIYSRDLLAKIRALGARRLTEVSHAPRSGKTVPARFNVLQSRKLPSPKVLVIGSSTGGPQALQAFFRDLPGSVRMPILVAQHMPAAFTPILAQHIAQAGLRPCREAQHGTVLKDGHVYLAPGDFHMEISREGSDFCTRLTQEPPENFCRPSVNPLFRSAAQHFGQHVLAVMLTGMGSDGLDGAHAIHRAGGTIIAQDEESSVVWGMPGAVANANLCTAVLPLPQIAPRVGRLAVGELT